MTAADRESAISSPPQANCPTPISQGPTDGVSGCLLMVRVGRVLQDLCAGRQVADEDLLQHRDDCRELMEAAAARWETGCESREVVEQWQRCLREAQIQQSIADGVGFFVTQGDADRVALVRRTPA